MKTHLLALLLFPALAASASATAMENAKRAAEFKALVRSKASVQDGADFFLPAAANAADAYDNGTRADFLRSTALRTRADYEEITRWWKLSYQELQWLRKEAGRLNRSCDAFGPGDAPAKAAARKVAASARRFLVFLDGLTWRDPAIRETMTHEGRQTQVEAIAEWDRLVLCVEKGPKR